MQLTREILDSVELVVRNMELTRTILSKIDKNATKLTGFPHITQNGKWITTLDGDWTGGFWVYFAPYSELD